ncbi:MAG: ATP synthase F1 subunit epsilon, partial [Oscillibacter sp.]|nr:ATP synthase F1 subunit epsilon [Oscillibacter sp.]
METFRVHILAADRTFYEGPCVSLTIPTTDGEQGILAHHASMIAAVQPGTLRYQIPGEPVRLAPLGFPAEGHGHAASADGAVKAL